MQIQHVKRLPSGSLLEGGLDEERAAEESRDSFVHERVVLGEVDVELRQRLAVGYTTSWPWFRHLEKERKKEEQKK